jgi:hypothetical protein
MIWMLIATKGYTYVAHRPDGGGAQGPRCRILARYGLPYEFVKSEMAASRIEQPGFLLVPFT